MFRRLVAECHEEETIDTERVNERPPEVRPLIPKQLYPVVQLQVEFEAPDNESQNFCNVAPPAAPIAGMVMVCSCHTPFVLTIPLGTTSEGWSNGALWLRTRSSVNDFRKATTAVLSSALKPARRRLGSMSAEGKSPPRL